MTGLFYVLVGLNIALALIILVLYQRAKQRICDEKVATFGGCVAALALGLLREDRQRGIDATVEGLKRMRPGMDGEELKFRLVRAAACRLQRNDVSFDLLGETMHVASQALFPANVENEKVADYVQALDYVQGDPQKLPQALYGDQRLFLAEVQEENVILKMYRASIEKSKINPFKSAIPVP